MLARGENDKHASYTCRATSASEQLLSLSSRCGGRAARRGLCPEHGCSGQKEVEALAEAARARQHRDVHTTAIATRLSSARVASPAIPGTLPAGAMMSQCCTEALAGGSRAHRRMSASTLEKRTFRLEVRDQRARIRWPGPQQRKLHRTNSFRRVRTFLCAAAVPPRRMRCMPLQHRATRNAFLSG